MASKKKPRSQPKSASKARASWRGTVQLGLVSFAVEALNAHSVQDDRVSFHQLHKKCHSRIKHQKTCPIHGPVEQDEIASGYEYSKGRYVEIDPDELDQLRSAKERALTVDAFIAPEEIDPVFFDGRMYYLSPSGDGAREPYTIFLEAMRKMNRWGVGQVIWSGREQLAVLRPFQDALHMAMLNYTAEIRDPAETVAELLEIRGSDKKVKLAEQLIESWSSDTFDLGDYEDTYIEKVREIIDAKVEGRETVAPEADDEPHVINLMDALRKSVNKGGQASASARPARKTATKKKAAPARKRKSG